MEQNLYNFFDQCATNKAKDEGIDTGYLMDDLSKTYHHYMSKDEWQKRLQEMKQRFPKAYEQFGEEKGKELRVGKYPPKMASFGSSSYMLFELAKEIVGFQFESILPTNVGGNANLDGYFVNEKETIFVEAKKHEIYNSHKIKPSVYDDVYKYLVEKGIIDCYKTHFYKSDSMIQFFDFKQIVCHFLAISADCIKQPDSYVKKPVHFVYLMLNPKDYSRYESYERLVEHYKYVKERECSHIDFPELFASILEYQAIHIKRQRILDESLKKIILNFKFEFIDQDKFKSVFE